MGGANLKSQPHVDVQEEIKYKQNLFVNEISSFRQRDDFSIVLKTYNNLCIE